LLFGLAYKLPVYIYYSREITPSMAVGRLSVFSSDSIILRYERRPLQVPLWHTDHYRRAAPVGEGGVEVEVPMSAKAGSQ